MPSAGTHPKAAHEVQHDPPARVRTLFISDVHLGTRACQAELLTNFLRRHEPNAIFLIGDIAEGWRLTSDRPWAQSHIAVVAELLRRARAGTKVVYVPGNHDELMRRCAGLSFAGIEVALHAIHEAADGRRYLLTHGDQFDAVLAHAPWLATVGHHAYHLLLGVNTAVNAARRRLGLNYWSLAGWAKQNVKRVVSYVSAFEECLSAEARRHGAHGVICGHIHRAADREVLGIRYLNTGDWVESCSAIVEHNDGRLEVVQWRTPWEWSAQRGTWDSSRLVSRNENAALDVFRDFQLRIRSAFHRRAG